MKKETTVALLPVVALLIASGCASFEQWMEKPAPDFTVTDIDGQTFTLSQQKGKAVIVVISTTTCPFCKKQVPDLIGLRNSYNAGSTAIIAISNEDNAVLRAFRQARGINYTMASTQNLPSPYSDITGIPRFFFIDRNGNIRDTASGYHNLKALTTRVSALDVAPVPAK